MIEKLILFDTRKTKLMGYLDAEKPVILYGPPGIGKTALCIEVARDRGTRLVRINSSDLRTKEELLPYYRIIRTRSVTLKIGGKKTGKLLFLFDEVDGFHDWDFLKTMLLNASHDVLLTANELWKIPKWVFQKPVTPKSKKTVSFVKTMKIYPPRQEEVVKILRAKGIDGNFAGITRDIRAAQHTLQYGSQSEQVLNNFEQIKIMINNPRSIPKFIDREGKWAFMSNWNAWFLHHLPIFHRGYQLFESLEIMSMVDIHSDPYMLRFLPETLIGGKGQGPEYPEYLKVLKKYKWGKKSKKKV